MTWITIIGYTASLFTAITFYMRTIIPLRLFAICSNIAFIAYGYFGKLYPVLILHLFLLPLNIIRLVQMKKLVKKVRESSRGDCSMDCLVPYMTKSKFSKGETLFKKGDVADKIFYINKGIVELIEIDKKVSNGEIIGEIGIFSPFKERTATAVCEDECEIFTINDETITQLFFQNPSFGFHLIQLVCKRFSEKNN
jgi:hypothetical protein